MKHGDFYLEAKIEGFVGNAPFPSTAALADEEVEGVDEVPGDEFGEEDWGRVDPSGGRGGGSVVRQRWFVSRRFSGVTGCARRNTTR